MLPTLTKHFLARAETEVPAFLRDDASLWPGIRTKLQEQAAKDAETWEEAYGHLIPVDDLPPAQVPEILQWPLERAEEVASCLESEFQRFWSSLPEVVRSSSEQETVAAAWRIREGVGFAVKMLASKPAYRYTPRYPAATAEARELVAKVLSEEAAQEVDEQYKVALAAAVARLPAYVKTEDVMKKLEEQTYWDTLRAWSAQSPEKLPELPEQAVQGTPPKRPRTVSPPSVSPGASSAKKAVAEQATLGNLPAASKAPKYSVSVWVHWAPAKTRNANATKTGVKSSAVYSVVVYDETGLCQLEAWSAQALSLSERLRSVGDRLTALRLDIAASPHIRACLI